MQKGKFCARFYYGNNERLLRWYGDNEGPFDFSATTQEDEAEYKAHTYYNEIKLNCTFEEFDARYDEIVNDIFGIESELACEDGVLDLTHERDELEYTWYCDSIHVSLDEAPIVWKKLVNLLKKANLLAE